MRNARLAIIRIDVNIKARTRNHRCGRAITITYSECVFVALVTQNAMRMRSITLSSVACPALT